MQIITIVINSVWLFLALLLLWRIWRNSTRQNQQAQATIISVALKNSEAAQKSADAAFLLASKLVKEEKPPA